MKFCYKCGEQLNDTAIFCPKCGVKLDDAYINDTDNDTHITDEIVEDYDIETIATSPQKQPMRKSMKIWAIICLVFAIIYFIIGLAVLRAIMSMTALFLVLSIMFLILGKSPKNSPYVFGKSGGITKKKFVIASIIVGYIICAIIMANGMLNMPPTDNENSLENQNSSITETNNKETSSKNDKTQKYNISQFANITSKELVSILGEPTKKEKGNCTGSFEIPCINYDYDNLKNYGEISFVLVNDKVVRLTSYNKYQFSNIKNILTEFGIEKSGNCATVISDDTALRYRCVTNEIDDFWISSLDKKNKSFEFLQITYDMEYYEEWYLPMGIGEQASYQSITEEAVKKILKSPKSADFAGVNDWKIVKNKYYIGVQSYVDAQNSFGADIRSEFTFIYNHNKQLVYAIFDGKEIVNEGYTKTEELIKNSLK